nr:MAG TPA: hypothetical protein [Caudoviricetes sp.]
MLLLGKKNKIHRAIVVFSKFNLDIISWNPLALLIHR